MSSSTSTGAGTTAQSVAAEHLTDEQSPLFQLMVRINRLNLKAADARTLSALQFVILNDTMQVIRYDRAVLCDLTRPENPRLIGVSGQTEPKQDAEVSRRWVRLMRALTDPTKPLQPTRESFSSTEAWDEFQKLSHASVLWFPIAIEGEVRYGLWIERWHAEGERTPPEIIDLLMNFLIKSYAMAWSRFSKGFSFNKLGLRKHHFMPLLALSIGALFFIRVPMRVVAPCEVVPENPILVTAPLNGIVEEVVVTPGQWVNKGDLLFSYDKRAPMQDLRVAQKEVEILQAETNRALAQGLNDPKVLGELAVLRYKLEKEKVQLSLAEYRASQLAVKAVTPGVVMFEGPDEWRGKPVQIGEKVLVVSDPKETKLRIWIPENDNIILDPNQLISIYLNINPEDRREAKLIYIANESIVNEKNLPSFVAEAEWNAPQEEIKLGLKGTAVLYGEEVSLFYFLMRRPWAAVRGYLGI